MKKMKIVVLLMMGTIISLGVSAQKLTVSGQIGYSSPQGDAFLDDDGERLASFGLGYDLDILVTLPSFDDKLSVGAMFSGNAIFGKESEAVLDIGIYGLSLYGIKGHYRLLELDKLASPYASLSLGLSQFATPDITIGDETIKGESAFSLGVKPEIGFDIGGLLISAAYFVPMKYEVDSETGHFDGTAGTFTISIGYREYIDL